MKTQILKVEFNRNGVSGIGFTKVLFNLIQDGQSETLVAILTTDDNDNYVNEQCFVSNPIDFSQAYRGDAIASKLIPALNKFNNK